jgi:DNA-binding IclR family transcriptional regulator
MNKYENNIQPNKNQENTVQSVDRAIQLLNFIADSHDPVLIHELVEQTKMNRTTVWRLLTTLESHDFIERDPLTKGYQLGYGASRLAWGERKYDSLARRVRPRLEQLMEETNETVFLSVPKHFGILTVDQIDPPHSVRVVNYVNAILPLHCTSNGKIWLSSLLKEELHSFLQQSLEKHTSFTMTDPDQLQKDLELIRNRGFGTSFRELDESENGLSVPIFDNRRQIIAFISVSGPIFRFTQEKILELGPRLIEMASDISQDLYKQKS